MKNLANGEPPIVEHLQSGSALDPPILPPETTPTETMPTESATAEVGTDVAIPLQGGFQTEIAANLPPMQVPATSDALVPNNPANSEPANSVAGQPVVQPITSTIGLRWYQGPAWLLGRSWDLTCLCVLIAIVAAIPLIQLASLGYLLQAAGNLANRKPWRTALPGLRMAGKLGTFALFAAISWIPIYLLSDLAYSAQLLQPQSAAASGWRAGAFLAAIAWVVHIGWAAMRGGRWWNLIWPAPLKFVTEIWRPRTWSRAGDRLYDLVANLKFPKLWWLGARASAGALLWTCVPVSLMIIGERAHDLQPAAAVGIVGALGMTIVMLYLPMLQVHMAATNRSHEIFNVRAIRQSFMRAPWFYALSIFVLCALAIPLYLLRIEATPSQLVWAPSLVFVIFMLPAKLLIGTALGYAKSRTHARHWLVRWPACAFELASVLIYVGALYVAQSVAWEGAFVMYFQHAVLVPAPLTST